MIRLAVALAAAALLAPAAQAKLPPPVARTHAALLAAASTGSYAKLAPLVPRRLTYSYGVERPGGAIAYWRSLEPKQHPIRVLAALLRMPPVLSRGFYVWPFAYSVPPEKLTPAQLRLLAPLFGPKDVAAWKRFGGYFAWRVGIDRSGRWMYFVSGD